MGFFSDISSGAFKARAEELRQNNPSDEVLYFMLADERFLEWAHSAGVARDERLRQLAPPVPPHHLRSTVAADTEPVFLWTGAFDAKVFHDLFRMHWTGNTERPVVFDFGCGCGRMMRFMGQHPGFSVVGSDINDAHVDWCASNLTGVETTRNGALPPLQRADRSVDFLYSLSIFTHLPEKSTTAWLTEIARVLSGGGIAIVTTHGPTALDIIASSSQHQSMFRISSNEANEIKAQLNSDGYRYLRYSAEVLAFANAGDDYGNSFTDHDYIRHEWPKAALEIVDIVPGGMRGWQDLVILRKPD